MPATKLDSMQNDIKTFLEHLQRRGVTASITFFQPNRAVTDVSTFSTCKTEADFNLAVQNHLLYIEAIAQQARVIKLVAAVHEAQHSWNKYYPTSKIM